MAFLSHPGNVQKECHL